MAAVSFGGGFNFGGVFIYIGTNMAIYGTLAYYASQKNMTYAIFGGIAGLALTMAHGYVSNQIGANKSLDQLLSIAVWPGITLTNAVYPNSVK